MSLAFRSLVAVSTVLLVAACGSGGASTDSANVQSASASGEVVAVNTCSPGPPAGSPLSITDQPDSWDYDGVVGAVYNSSGKNLWLSVTTGGTSSGKCRVDAGQRAAYAFSTPSDIDVVIRVWDGEASDATYSTIRINDGLMDNPQAYLNGAINDTKACKRTLNDAWTDRLSEGTSNTVPSKGQVWPSYAGGEFTFKRLKDDDKTAAEWTGAGAWKTGDWARIDITVTKPPSCE